MNKLSSQIRKICEQLNPKATDPDLRNQPGSNRYTNQIIKFGVSHNFLEGYCNRCGALEQSKSWKLRRFAFGISAPRHLSACGH